jgi:antitoxin component YwqK of YwqJK toxin-antitoxin module
MIQMVVTFLSCTVLCLAIEESTAYSSEDVSRDELAIAGHIKALSDEKSDVRQAAAESLRNIVAKYPSGTSDITRRDSGEAFWLERTNQVKPGMREADVLKVLPRFAESSDWSEIGSGGHRYVSYRLDSHWIISILYRHPENVVPEPERMSESPDRLKQPPKLIKREHLVYVKAPTNYTGSWTNWYVNGQKGHETEFKDGKNHGVLTHYHDNGRKGYEQHYSNGVADGTDTGWTRDGQLSYTGQYRNAKRDGKWVHWHENGQKRSESNLRDEKQHGRQLDWYENGVLYSETNYQNGVKHGIEASWDEHGVLHYRREYANGQLVDLKAEPKSED